MRAPSTLAADVEVTPKESKRVVRRAQLLKKMAGSRSEAAGNLQFAEVSSLP
jgi:hypothetical protein